MSCIFFITEKIQPYALKAGRTATHPLLQFYYVIINEITPEINALVEDTLNEWFGIEYELIEE